MKVAFDLGGVLGAQPALQCLAKLLSDAGHEVYVISSARDTPLSAREQNKRWTEHIAKQLQIRLAGIYITLHPAEGPEEAKGRIAGQAKAKVMKELGCEILVDDNRQVAEEVRKAGLQCIKVDGSPNFWETSTAV